MAAPSSWVLPLKFLLISIGFVSIAMMAKSSVPSIIDFVVHEIPVIWSKLLSWLRPPYLYLIINGIIITIAVSSRFLHKFDHGNDSEQLLSSNAPPPDVPSDVTVSAQPEFAVMESPAVNESEATVWEVKTAVMNGPEAKAEDEDEDEDEEDALVISRSTSKPPQRINSSEIETDYLFPTPEKPLVSARFGNRKPLKASPEGGRALSVAKQKRHETLESTWKAITDGRHMPLTRHLRRSDTWENPGSQFSTTPQDQSPQNVKKSETFRDRTNYDPQSSANSSPRSGTLRKEPSPSQDELNRRVEAFIRKFNEDMRLQREESLNQYMEMINRGAH